MLTPEEDVSLCHVVAHDPLVTSTFEQPAQTLHLTAKYTASFKYLQYIISTALVASTDNSSQITERYN